MNALLFVAIPLMTMSMLHVWMGIIGFASVLPVSLPFQVYSMAIGGVKHCAMIVGIFEFVSHFVEAGFDLATGELLEEEKFVPWLACNTGFAVLGLLLMATFYWLDWRRAPNASTMTAAWALQRHERADRQTDTKGGASQFSNFSRGG